MRGLCSKFDHGFDHAGFRFCPRWKFADDVVERSAVSDPWRGVDATVFDEADDAFEILRLGVAAGEEGEFAAVKIGIVECDVALEEADENDAAAGGWIFEGGHHGLGIASGVEDGCGKLMVRKGW